MSSGPVPWLSRLLNLNPVDGMLWKYLNVYFMPLYPMMDKIYSIMWRECLCNILWKAGISECAWQSMRHCGNLCMDMREVHIKHLLISYIHLRYAAKLLIFNFIKFKIRSVTIYRFSSLFHCVWRYSKVWENIFLHLYI